LASTTSAARRRRLGGVGDDRDACELAFAFGDCLEHGHALGADCKAISRVLDVAAGDDAAGRRLQRGADLEIRKRGVRMQARGAGCVE